MGWLQMGTVRGDHIHRKIYGIAHNISVPAVYTLLFFPPFFFSFFFPFVIQIHLGRLGFIHLFLKQKAQL